MVHEVRGFQNSPFVGLAEWKVIAGIIDIVRSAAGPNWRPAEITFVSRGRPSDATLEAYGNTRILTGQPRGSVLVAAADMAQTCIDRRSKPDHVNDPTIPPRTPSGLGEAWDFVTALRAIIRPYLAQGHPHLLLVAEIACALPLRWKGAYAQSLGEAAEPVEDLTSEALDIVGAALRELPNIRRMLTKDVEAPGLTVTEAGR